MPEQTEEINYLEPIIEEEDLVELEEDAGLLININSTCGSNCGVG